MIRWLRHGGAAAWFALAALVLSLCGVAVAGGAVVIDSSSDVANGSLTGNDVADGSVSGPDISPGYREEVAGEVVYARVDTDGDVDEPRSRGITDANVRQVSTPETGRHAYCFSGLRFTPRVATVTPEVNPNATAGDFDERDDAAPSIQRGAGTEGCPTGTQLSVTMQFEARRDRESLFGPGFERKPFYILIVR